jgi:hypothetical protein
MRCRHRFRYARTIRDLAAARCSFVCFQLAASSTFPAATPLRLDLRRFGVARSHGFVYATLQLSSSYS